MVHAPPGARRAICLAFSKELVTCSEGEGEGERVRVRGCAE